MRAKTGDRVRVRYTGKLPTGEVFDSSKEEQSLEFTIGAREVLRGLEEAVVGMHPGESKTAKIGAHNAYGAYDDALVVTVNKDNLKLANDFELRVGQLLRARGSAVSLRVIAVSASSVTLDANHPLAGQDLTFEIELEDFAAA